MSEPSFVGETEIGPGTGCYGLAIPPSHTAPNRILDADRCVADLVKPSRHIRCSAIEDAFTVEVKVSPELSMMVSVETEVQTCPELNPRVAQDIDGERSFGPVLHDCQKSAAHQPAIIRLEP